jgi:nifR3 family TIM-barrel protein
MISCHGLVYKQQNTLKLLHSCRLDRPLALQIFGADSALMGEAAAMLSDYHPDFIDINMGCPVKKVTRRGGGAALMADIRRAEAIVRNVVRNARCAVTVKMRAGVDSSSMNAVSFAQMAEAQGASAVTVHGRTWKQAFSGKSDWAVVRAVKRAVSLPVIGNGDITSRQEALLHLDRYCCDGVMIGRGALGNPWAFHPGGRPADQAEIVEGARRHFELLDRYGYMSPRLLALGKNHLSRYFKRHPYSSTCRQMIYRAPDWPHLAAALSVIGETARSSEISDR